MVDRHSLLYYDTQGDLMNRWNLTRSFFASLLLAAFAHNTHIAADECCALQSCRDNLGGLQIYGEFLYWKTVQEQIEYAAVLPGGVQNVIQAFNTSPVEIDEKLHIVDTSFEYEPGFPNRPWLCFFHHQLGYPT